ncbi:putative dehydrogenase [Abditibacterium utsteinense]|uniref:Putative dehydrogenase n=1 Tax=Abditibacterium utsteinense TaxID=1960156 RepID=A0A2S8SVB6_9BACT|nr:Gfo/Idh/MocA family oxidoreductase [Abditibacterium utsteinense]PQV64719.1 putative dehydrogenase [Abditibacterium utsteinense]
MKAILTGLGGRGLHWLQAMRDRDDVEFVAFVEPFEASIARAVDEYQVPRELIFSSLDEAIENTRADFVLDVTPPAVHHEIALKAFDAGLHVIGEKPLSDDFETAKKVAAAGTAAGMTHMITQNYRFGAQPRTTRKAIEDNQIGAPGQCDVRFYVPWADIPGSHYVTQPWMFINDMMVHHFDLMRYVLGENPVSVQAMTWNQPWGWHKGDACHSILFRFASGLVATHVASGCDVGAQTSYNGDWHIAGPNGSIDWDKAGTWYSHLHRTEEKVDKRAIEPLPVKAGEQAMMDEFFSAIDEKREPECSARDNLQSLAMVFGAIQSAKEGRVVALDAVN